MTDKIISLRKIEGAQILDTMNCVAFSERFFNRSRAWFIQLLSLDEDRKEYMNFHRSSVFKG